MSIFLPDLNASPNWRKRLLWIAFFGLCIGILLGIRPTYRAVKTWRAHQLVAQGEALVKRGTWNEAFAAAQAAYQLAPNDPDAIRLVAKILTAAGRLESLQYWRILLEEHPPQSADRLAFVAACLRFGRLDLAERHLNLALAEPEPSVEALRLAAMFTEHRGDRQRALQFARAVLEREPTDGQMKLFVGRQLILSDRPGEAQSGKDILWEFIWRDDASALEALRLLAGSRILNDSEARSVIDEIRGHPFRSFDDDFMIADLQIRLNLAQKEMVQEELTGRFGKGSPEAQLALVRWLNKHRAYERTLDLMPIELALASQDFLLAYLDALAASGKWEAIDKILEGPNVALTPVLLELFRARTAGELGNARAAELHWEQVHAYLKQDSQWAPYVAEYAERIGKRSDAKRAYSLMTKDRAMAQRGYEALVRLEEEEGNSRGLRDLMKEIARAFPDNPAPKNDLAYLNLLLGEEVQGAKAVAERLVEQFPSFVAYRTTLALAHLRANEPAAALKAYAGLAVNWAGALPGWKAIYAAVLGANGAVENARELAATIPSERLKKEEQALIQPWITELTSTHSKR